MNIWGITEVLCWTFHSEKALAEASKLVLKAAKFTSLIKALFSLLLSLLAVNWTEIQNLVSMYFK